MKSGELVEAEPLLFEVELSLLGDDGCAAVAGRVTQLCCSACLSEKGGKKGVGSRCTGTLGNGNMCRSCTGTGEWISPGGRVVLCSF